MTPSIIRILLIEDNRADMVLIREMLAMTPDGVTIEHCGGHKTNKV